MPAPTSVTVISSTTARDNQRGPSVDYAREELTAMRDKYEIIRDCLAGQEAVKKKGTKYLPMPNAADQTDENKARYEGYLARALFYNVTANTAAGLVGQVFAADPVSEFPDELDVMWEDVTGSGVSMIQQSKRTLSNVLAYGRAGLLTDFPRGKADGSAFTRDEVNEGIARPNILFYGPEDIINWRYRMEGAMSVLSLVVLNETYVLEDDGFEVKTGAEKRVLKLDAAGLYEVELWRRNEEKDDAEWYKFDTLYPTNNAGQRLPYIPFTFVGSQNNDHTVDRPPMYDIACINIAHFRNSADYEDSVYMVGQPTPYFTGLTEHWVDNVLKGKIQLGSRGAVPLPEGASAGLIQANENGMVKEAMEHKERQMIALGAQLVEDKQVQRTLGEAKMEAASVASILTSCAKNVSSAMEQCVRWACEFYGVESEDVIYELSTDFAISKLAPQERTQLLAEWNAGLITFTEARAQLRHSGIATLDDEEAKAEIEGDKESMLDLDATGGEYEVDEEGKVLMDADGNPVPKKAPAAPPVVE